MVRIQEKSGFGVGLHYTIDVLLGKTHEKFSRWGHDQISTFGIGTEFKKRQWVSIGQELLRQNFLQQSDDQFKTLSLTDKGWRALTSRTPIVLNQPLTQLRPQKKKMETLDFDQNLFSKLKILRRKLADERNVPAYIIFSDASLREMATVLPRNLLEFSEIPGVGESKLRQFGDIFVDEINSHLSLSSPKTEM